MKKTHAGFALLLVAVTFHVTLRALPQSADRGPAFEVVSIKRNTSGIGQGFRSNVVTWRPDGALTMSNVMVAVIISRARFGTVPAEILGLPEWARSERFDVSATSSLSQATADDRSAMLRAMLADRFKLALHVEKREQQAYDLVLARADGRLGPGLKPVETDCARIVEERAAAAEAALGAGTPQVPPKPPDFSVPPPPCTLRVLDAMVRDRSGDRQGQLGALLEGEATMNDLASGLLFTMGRLVVNKTALAGSYRMAMNFDMMSGRGGPALTPTDTAAPSIFTAI